MLVAGHLNSVPSASLPAPGLLQADLGCLPVRYLFLDLYRVGVVCIFSKAVLLVLLDVMSSQD